MRMTQYCLLLPKARTPLSCLLGHAHQELNGDFTLQKQRSICSFGSCTRIQQRTVWETDVVAVHHEYQQIQRTKTPRPTAIKYWNGGIKFSQRPPSRSAAKTTTSQPTTSINHRRTKTATSFTLRRLAHFCPLDDDDEVKTSVSTTTTTTIVYCRDNYRHIHKNSKIKKKQSNHEIYYEDITILERKCWYHRIK